MLRQARPLIAFDLGDTDAARAMAQRIADKTGREVKVTNEHGGEVCTVLPTPPATETLYGGAAGGGKAS